MTATIIPFPRVDARHHLRAAYAPVPRDARLDMLMREADAMLREFTIDACDAWLMRLDAWEAGRK